MADVEAIKRQAAADVEVVKQKARDAIEKLRRDIASAQNEATQYKSKLEVSASEVETLRQHTAEYERRIADMVVRQRESKISDERDEKIATLKAELTRAQDQIARLEHAPPQQNNNNDDAVNQLKDALAKSEDKLNRFKDAAKAQVLKLQEELRVKTGGGGGGNEADKQLRTALEESERERKTLQDQTARMQTEMQQFKDKAKAHMEKLQKELERRIASEDELKRTGDEERKRMSETYEAQIKALKATSASASSGGAAATPSPSDALVRMNKENKELQMKLDAANKNLQAERDEAKAQSRASRETIERAGKERTELKRELDTAKEDLRLASKELDKTRSEVKKLQELKLQLDPSEMQRKKEMEVSQYTDKINALEVDLRRERAKVEDLQKQVQRFDAEITRTTGQYLQKYEDLDRELVEKREHVLLMEEQLAEQKRTNILQEQRMEDLRRKSREQFPTLQEQLVQAKERMDEAVKAEQTARAEVNALSTSLKRQNSQQQRSTSPPPPQPAAQPSAQTSSRSDFKLLEEEKLKAESKRREAMDDLTKAKRDYGSAKREAIQLAESVDRLRTGLNKAALQAGGNLALAADRCDDALRQCVMQIEAAVAAIQARELARTGAPSQSAGLANEEGRMTRQHRQSSMDDPGSPQQKKEQEPEERLVNALNEAERRLDEMTASMRQLLPKVKHVATIAVQDKKQANVLASICNLSAVLARLFQRGDKQGGGGGDDHGGGYQGLQRPGMRGGRRVLPETPGQDSNFDLEEESSII